METDLRAYVAQDLRLHPRVAYQQIFNGPDVAQRLASALSPLPKFRRGYQGAITVIDWDHRIPTQQAVLRIHGYYSRESLAAGLAAYADRQEAIAARDRYPEFDVPDFEGLPADELYEIELSVQGELGRARLTSTWRRAIASADAHTATAVVQASAEYQHLVESCPDRPGYLGDLEAVSWTPPCESEYAHWTLDVWFLMAFDGRVGSGRSFLVDPEAGIVVSARDFSVRTG